MKCPCCAGGLVDESHWDGSNHEVPCSECGGTGQKPSTVRAYLVVVDMEATMVWHQLLPQGECLLEQDQCCYTAISPHGGYKKEYFALLEALNHVSEVIADISLKAHDVE